MERERRLKKNGEGRKGRREMERGGRQKREGEGRGRMG